MENNQPAPVQKESQKPVPALKPGGKIVPVLFILFAGAFFVQSLQIWQKEPVLSGSATFPLVVSGFMLLLVIMDFIQKLRMQSETDGMKFTAKLVAIAQYLAPIKVLVFLLMVIGYYILLELGVGFVISSAVFLLGSMCYLIRKQFLKNLLYTGICIGVLYLLFKVVFKVYLP